METRRLSQSLRWMVASAAWFLLSLCSPAAEQPAGAAEGVAAGNLRALIRLQPGQRSVLLPTGIALITGLPGGVLTASGAALLDVLTGEILPLPIGPSRVRSWHSATVLLDGTVLLLGGTDAAGNVVDVPERFDPDTLSFVPTEITGLLPRTQHSAVLLTDGRLLIVGGTDASGSALLDAELWNPKTGRSERLFARLSDARLEADAGLLPDGSVLISGGMDTQGKPVASKERFDPVTQNFRLQIKPPPE